MRRQLEQKIEELSSQLQLVTESYTNQDEVMTAMVQKMNDAIAQLQIARRQSSPAIMDAHQEYAITLLKQATGTIV